MRRLGAKHKKALTAAKAQEIGRDRFRSARLTADAFMKECNEKNSDKLTLDMDDVHSVDRMLEANLHLRDW